MGFEKNATCQGWVASFYLYLPPPLFVVRRILSAQRSINRIVEHLRYCFNGVNRATDRQDVFVMGGPISG